MGKLAVCILIIDKQKYNFLAVSLKEDHSDFNLPGGIVKKNESTLEAALRETKEETGIDIFNLIYLYENYDNDVNVITFYTYDFHGIINTIEDHKVKWLPIYELTNSKKWNKYNSEVYNKYLKL